MSKEMSIAVDLAHRAGEVILKHFTLGMKPEWKKDLSPVTIADKEINDLVLEVLQKEFPDYGILAEEGSKINNEDYVWICDPVDGTIPYSHGIPLSTFLLALTHKGESILGVIYDPFQKRLFTAEKGKGAFLNGKSIHVSNRTEFESSLIGLEFWRGTINLSQTYRTVLQIGAHIFRPLSIGYVDMLVACGEAIANVFCGTSQWDSAAPDIIVREAGGKFTDLYGNKPDFRNEIQGRIASNGLVHEQLLTLIKKDLENK